MDIQRIDKATPSGGDYSYAVFLNDHWEVTDKVEATMMIVTECKDDGTFVCETILNINMGK